MRLAITTSGSRSIGASGPYRVVPAMRPVEMAIWSVEKIASRKKSRSYAEGWTRSGGQRGDVPVDDAQSSVMRNDSRGKES